ncbi:SGNH/GDSL hydrolase family protein [Dermatobacter hominis]|uniref:SGNH/GDSL hydrolase family protein n=1 Tax=Dermatobacter hominis TaxID=2884263 RepID=UPI001D0F6385|nr:SGNH/GDSL hydrolase family protein [Dermatobacter hominis]UDY37456.1 SGNH/GDSL hydrolase family protein [Dermatobacter hominis]
MTGTPQLSALRVPAIAACLLLVAAIAPSCSKNQGERVAIVGDSLVTFDEADLRAEMGDDFDLKVSGNFGKQVLGAIPPAEVVSTTDAAQLIVNLGTNDVRAGTPVEQSMAALSALIGLYPKARCIHLVNINEHMVDGTTGQVSTDAARRFNDALEQLVGTDDRLGVIDWNAEVEDTLEGEPPTSTLTTDSVHLTKEGNEVLNGLYGKAVRSC